MTDEEYRIIMEQKKQNISARQQRKCSTQKETLCWRCKNLRCSWIQNLIPVRGWTADPTIIRQGRGKNPKEIPSYFVYECPEFK